MKDLPEIVILKMGVVSTVVFMLMIVVIPFIIVATHMLTYIWAAINIALLLLPVLISVLRI